jgi:hypothetical protein
MMPNSVQAAAEGMPDANRRTALALTATGIVAALGGMAAGVNVSHASWNTLAAVIEAHKAAFKAFDAALTAMWAAEADYFATHPKERLIPLSVGGAVTFCVRFDLDDYAEDCRTRIAKIYADLHLKLDALKLPPELHAPALQFIRRKMRTDMAALRKAHKAEVASRNAHGYGGAVAASNLADTAEDEALSAVCAYPCTTVAELDMKGRYLLAVTGGRFAELDADDQQALLRSFIIGTEA